MPTDKRTTDTTFKEWDRMLRGEIYEAGDPKFFEILMSVRKKLKEFNDLDPDMLERQHEILNGLIGTCPDNIHVNQPFRCDYGYNIHIGENFFANFNLTILDEAEVTIGQNVFIGPNVSIYTACHPLDAATRNTFVQWAEPVIIGDDVWIGGNVVILPGVRIGSRSVIGAGSVVSKSLPSDFVYAGNPARPIKRIKQSDSESCSQLGLDSCGC